MCVFSKTVYGAMLLFSKSIHCIFVCVYADACISGGNESKGLFLVNLTSVEVCACACEKEIA